jgi:hypothetical protein
MSKVFLFFMIISVITLIVSVLKFYQYHSSAYIASAILSFVTAILNLFYYVEYKRLN